MKHDELPGAIAELTAWNEAARRELRRLFNATDVLADRVDDLRNVVDALVEAVDRLEGRGLVKPDTGDADTALG